MKAQHLFEKFSRSHGHSLALIAMSTMVMFSVGCGTSATSQGSQGQTFSGNTNVTLLLSSTANDELSEYNLTINSITLTTKSGKTAALVSNPQGAEFIHLNGTTEPLSTVSIPQGVYISATAEIGYAQFTCVTLIPPTDPNNPGGLLTAIYAYGQTPSSQVTVNIPRPITVTGNSLGLVLNLAVAQSASLGSCYNPPGSLATYAITPTFDVTTVSQTDEIALNTQVSTVDPASNGFTATLADGQSLALSVNNSTTFQGISSLAEVTPGMLLTVDAAFQSDGSQLARRIAVADTNTSTISDLLGPVVQTNPSSPSGIGPSGFMLGRQQQGFFAANGEAAVWMPYNLSNASFQISGAFSNLGALPFVPTFNASNLADGQNVHVTTESTNFATPGYIPAATVTLSPQTLNATVNAVSNSGGFQVYTTALAPTDLFPTLAIQQGQSVVLNNPQTVEVYVDANTQRLNSMPLALGNTFRFYGVVFNDNGTLRMDCSLVNDGVTASSGENTSSRTDAGQPRIVRSSSSSIQQIVVTHTTH